MEFLVLLLAPFLFFKLLDELDVEGKGFKLANENVEGLGESRFKGVLAFNDGFVNSGAALYVVGLDGEHLLEGVSRSVGLKSPNFHLSEPLASELGLTAQGLLSNEGVRSGGTGVYLVVCQVDELQHVHVTDGYVLVEGFAG